jgi:hypothetical protein
MNEINIESLGEIVGYNFGKYCPGVIKKDDGSYSVRVIERIAYSRNGSRSISYGYFTLDKDAVITSCPRSLTKAYKGRKIRDIEAALEKYKGPSL